jgi:hypothetical protein
MNKPKDRVHLVLPYIRDEPERAIAGGSSLVVVREPFSDQSDADQSAADADHDGSVADVAASTADQVTSTEDQDASDRDQVTADRQHDAANSLTPAEEQAYAVAREDRQTVTVDREQTRVRRERTALLRRATAALRDQIRRPRSRSTAIRKRLVADGVSAQLAVQWCDAWEVEAARTKVAADEDYWSHGTHWIWTERAAGRTPGGPPSGQH